MYQGHYLIFKGIPKGLLGYQNPYSGYEQY